jgi:hypothetical protein
VASGWKRVWQTSEGLLGNGAVNSRVYGELT